MNDEHDNAATDKEMNQRYNPAHVRAYTDDAAAQAGYMRRYVGPWPDQKSGEAGGVVKPNPIHTDRSVQHIDIRIYYGEDMDPEDVRDTISSVLQDSGDMCFMISAYQLKNNGFGHLLPDDKPLA